MNTIKRGLGEIGDHSLSETINFFFPECPLSPMLQIKCPSSEIMRSWNAVAHSGRVLTDISLIQHMLKRGSVVVWTKGLSSVCGLGFWYAQDITEKDEVINLLSICLDALLQEYKNHSQQQHMLLTCETLTLTWKSCVNQGETQVHHPWKQFWGLQCCGKQHKFHTNYPQNSRKSTLEIISTEFDRPQLC